MHFIISLIALLSLVALSQGFVGLVDPLPPALGGSFGRNRSLAFGNSFADGNATCTAAYNGGAIYVMGDNATGTTATILHLSGSCEVNGTFDGTNNPILSGNGNNFQFNISGELSTVACGLNFQIGMANGVMGGAFVSQADTRALLPLCVYYTRISASNTKLATIDLSIYMGSYTADNMYVQCSEARPPMKEMILTMGALECVGEFGQRYNCINSPQSRCMNSTKGESDIGIGMSVGGIGLLLVTLFFIIVIQKFTATKSS